MHGKKGYAGLVGSVRILARLYWRPATTREVSRTIGASPASRCFTAGTMNALFHAGLIHITEWVSETGRGEPVPRWAYGPGESAPYPCKTAPRLPPRRATNLIAFIAVVQCLREGEAKLADLREVSGLSEKAVRRIVTALRDAKLVYISGYEARTTSNGKPFVEYTLGRRPDVPRPPRQTYTECSRRWRRNRQQRDLTLKFIPSLAANASNTQQRA